MFGFEDGKCCGFGCRTGKSVTQGKSYGAGKPPLFPLLFIASVAGTSAFAAGPARINLGHAGSFVILSEAGVTDVPASKVVGSVGTSPITGAADHLTCTEVTHGRVYSVDAAGPAPCSRPNPTLLLKAVSSMHAAYTDAAGRLPDVTELGAGNIGGLTIAPGVYKWTTGLTIPSNVTLMGGPKDVWIFQISQDVDLAGATAVRLRGGAKPKNVFWQVSGKVTIGAAASFEGNVLCKTAITMETGAALHGRLLAQTAVNLQMNVLQRPHL